MLLFLLHLTFQRCIDELHSKPTSTQAHSHSLVSTMTLPSVIPLFLLLIKSGHLYPRSACLDNTLFTALTWNWDEFGTSDSLLVLFIRKCGWSLQLKMEDEKKKGCKEGNYMIRLRAWGFVKNWNYNLVHFPRDGMTDRVISGCEWKINSLSCLHVWPQVQSWFQFVQFYNPHSPPIIFPWGNLSCLQSKELTGNKLNSCHLDLPPWARYQCAPSYAMALCIQSVRAVNKDLTGGHYPFRECHALVPSLGQLMSPKL